MGELINETENTAAAFVRTPLWLCFRSIFVDFNP